MSTITLDDLKRAVKCIKDNSPEIEKEISDGFFITYQGGLPIRIRLSKKRLKEVTKILGKDFRQVRHNILRRQKIVTYQGIPVLLSEL